MSDNKSLLTYIFIPDEIINSSFITVSHSVNGYSIRCNNLNKAKEYNKLMTKLDWPSVVEMRGKPSTHVHAVKFYEIDVPRSKKLGHFISRFHRLEGKAKLGMYSEGYYVHGKHYSKAAHNKFRLSEKLKKVKGL
jgi:hypothetical protein